MVSKRTKNQKSLRRPKIQYSPRAVTLIVCEDGKSSPQYFKQFRKAEGLTSTEIEVIGQECGNAPISVIDCAKNKKDTQKKIARRNPDVKCYDKIYCVLDVEAPGQHESLNRAINKAKANKIIVILSNPCFEYWFLLHFEKASKPFQKSSDAESSLKIYIPNYKKGDDSTFNLVYPHTSIAIENAEQVIREKGWGEDLRECNPSTHVYKLIQYLQYIATQQPKLNKS